MVQSSHGADEWDRAFFRMALESLDRVRGWADTDRRRLMDAEGTLYGPVFAASFEVQCFEEAIVGHALAVVDRGYIKEGPPVTDLRKHDVWLRRSALPRMVRVSGIGVSEALRLHRTTGLLETPPASDRWSVTLCCPLKAARGTGTYRTPRRRALSVLAESAMLRCAWVAGDRWGRSSRLPI